MYGSILIYLFYIYLSKKKYISYMLYKYIQEGYIGVSRENPTTNWRCLPQGLRKYEWLDDDNPTFKATPPKSGLNLVSLRKQ